MLLKSISNKQPGTLALSPRESELRAMSRGVVEGQHLRHLCRDLGCEGISIKVRSGASATSADAPSWDQDV